MRRNADSLPDGEHIIGVFIGGVAGGVDALQVRLVLNWFDELRAKVPVP